MTGRPSVPMVIEVKRPTLPMEFHCSDGIPEEQSALPQWATFRVEWCCHSKRSQVAISSYGDRGYTLPTLPTESTVESCFPRCSPHCHSGAPSGRHLCLHNKRSRQAVRADGDRGCQPILPPGSTEKMLARSIQDYHIWPPQVSNGRIKIGDDGQPSMPMAIEFNEPYHSWESTVVRRIPGDMQAALPQ